MDTKSRRFSHSIFIKCLVFIIMIVSFTGSIKTIVDLVVQSEGDVRLVFEDDYYQSESYAKESYPLVNDLAIVMTEYKSKEYILSGKTISEAALNDEMDSLFYDYINENDLVYEPNDRATYKTFEKEYQDDIIRVKERLIKNDLQIYENLLQRIKKVENPLYYASDGDKVYTNSPKTKVDEFKDLPSYIMLSSDESYFYPKEIEGNYSMDWINSVAYDLEDHVIQIGFPEAYLKTKMTEWTETRLEARDNLYWSAGFLIAFIISFIYLLIVSGRKAFSDQQVHLNPIDRLYIDLNMIICAGLVLFYIIILDTINFTDIANWIIPMTLLMFIPGSILLFSIVRHIKNRSFFKHTLIYHTINPIFTFVKEVYNNGSLAVKTVLIVVGYPLLIAATFFIFPITIGVAAWFAFKKVQSFQSIQAGVKRIKEGDIQHYIQVEGEGELTRLAENINGITDGLKSAVDSELKSERLKAELITNVSHDIRTPLTSIITYVDLLKREDDPSKIADYVNVLDQKSKRLKMLTDDLFEASKASTGTTPVNFEQLEMISLVTQGLGEVSDQIEEKGLEFKFNHPDEKLFIMADGKLLWRSIENILSNIFKYSLNGSRVYVNLEDLGSEVLLTFKNISSYELNISADELMERFKRGDESRTTQGSGLGLSITKSLIEMQHGKFVVEIDGDLFKAMIYMPKTLN